MRYVVIGDKAGNDIGPMYIIGPYDTPEEAGEELDRMAKDPRWKEETLEVPVLNPPGTPFEELRQ